MKTHHQFYVGEFTCYALLDGHHEYPDPAKLLFPSAPANELDKALSSCGIALESWLLWTSSYSCLLVKTKSHHVLFDTGAGMLLPEAGQLVANLRAIGIEPEDINLVLLSHAHPDHIGAADCFPNARIIMNRREWDFWNSNPELPRLPPEFRDLLLSMITPQLDILRSRIELMDRYDEIVPGIKALNASGHTPGHMAFSIVSGEEELLYIGDAILHPAHLKNPQWSALVDVTPEQAVITRKRLLDRSVATSAPLFSFHFPFPCLSWNSGE